VQVIHHNTAENISRLIAEIWRMLQPEGLLFATVPMYRNQAKRFRQIKENTFVPLDGREEGIPHHYFDEKRIREFLSAFKILDIHVDLRKHYCFLGEKSGY
jgi:SAM-dependent methyltransferase